MSPTKLNSTVFVLALTLLIGCNTTPEVESVPANQQLNVFPNPAIDYVALYINNPGGPGWVRIYHGEGKPFMEGQVVNGENRFTVDVQSWPKGKYEVVLLLDNKNVTSTLIKF